MRLEAVLVVVSTFLAVTPTSAQTVAPELEEAYYSWERGEYASALDGYLSALNGQAGDRLKDEIALRTGELFEVTTLTEAGTDIRLALNGRFGTYTVGAVAEPTIALFELGDTPRVISTFQGRDPTLSSVGTVAFVRVVRTPELAAAEQAVLDAATRQDRAALRRHSCAR